MKPMKRIGIDARFWGEAGPGRYVSNLVKELEKLDRRNRYFIFLTSKAYGSYTPKNKHFTKVRADYRWYSLPEQLFYPRLLYRYNLDLLHFAQFNMPLLYLRPFTVTIHDMILHDYPIKKGGLRSALVYPVKKCAYLVNFWWAARRSRAIAVPSKDAKKDLVSRLGVSPGKIIITREGFSAELRVAKHKPSGGKRVLAKYGVKRPYLLFVGSMYPHKNLERLLEAFALLEEKIDLVLVGKESFFSKKLRREVEKMGLKDRVLFPGERAPGGYVPDTELPAFYQNASAFVFPSLKEGFGIPPLEAMAFGIPIAASRASCIPEVCGKAALYFDPKKPKEIAARLTQVLSDISIRRTLVREGGGNLKRFSWQKMAEQTLDMFQKQL